MFTVIDRNTRWFEVLPLSDISAKSCAAVLTQGWIARYGVPAVITSDLKDALCACLAGPARTAHLPWVLLGLHAFPRKEDNISTAQAVFGTPIVCTWPIFG
jgi:hypothetical protein